MTKHDFSWINNDMEFDTLLELAQDQGIGNILTIPGVYEIVREYYNNEVIEYLCIEHNRCVCCGNPLDDNGNCDCER